MCTHAHHKREAQSPLRLGSRVHLRALEALWIFDALSCYLSLIFKYSDTKWDLKTYLIKFFFCVLGGGGGGHMPATLPLDLPLFNIQHNQITSLSVFT